MTSPTITITITTSAANAITAANAAIAADDLRVAEEWADARTPWQAVAQRCSPETRARRAALFATLERAKGTRTTGGKLLNSAGRRQATLEPMPSRIGIARPKTVEEIAAAALTTSRVERSAQPSNRYAMKAGTR